MKARKRSPKSPPAAPMEVEGAVPCPPPGSASFSAPAKEPALSPASTIEPPRHSEGTRFESWAE
jgi:hypothetical protein